MGRNDHGPVEGRTRRRPVPAPSPRTTSVVTTINEVNTLKSAVRRLQKDSEEQLELEKETQATLEHLGTQLNSVRRSFALLADVNMQEMDELKAWVRRRQEDQDRRIDECLAEVQSVGAKLVELTESIAALEEKQEQEEVKRLEQINELLSGQRVLSEEVRDAKKAHVDTYRAAMEGASGARKHADRHHREVRAMMAELETSVNRVKSEFKKLQSKRLEDLELVEGSLGRIQEEQARVGRTSAESAQRVSSEVAQLKGRVEEIDNQLSMLKVDILDMRERAGQHQRDTHQRFESSKMLFRRLGEAVGIAELGSVR